MISILSTKCLTSTEKRMFSENDFHLTEIDLITIRFKDFTLNSVGNLLLFTSKNAVKSVLNHSKSDSLKNIPCICVGEKTAELLTKSGWEVIHFEEYASALSTYVEQNHFQSNITFFSGNLRKDTIVNSLKINKIQFTEIQVYETLLSPQRIEKPQKAILFFSPSGVQSYVKMNNFEEEICFCIGKTTADEVKKYTNNVIISDKTTTESLIEKCISFFRKTI